MTAINIEGVARSFAGVPAVDDVSIAIRDGEFFTLLGPSGCGKTTLLRMVAGFCELDRGRILLGETRIDTLPPHKRNTGMVFQNYAVFPNLNVGDNVAYGLRARKVGASEIRSRVERALKLVQLDGYAERWPHQLSGGQLQRVAIARAIVIEPPLILMDEPLSNLDAKLRLETRAEIRRIHRELDRATVYVTHDQDEALSLADRIVVMKDGVVQQIAAPHEVYAQPSNLHVARFMGYRNVLHLDVAEDRGDRVTVTAPDIKLTGVRKAPINGTRASVAIRPEEMTIVTTPAVENVIAGRVENVEYGGRDSLVDVVTPKGTVLHVRAPVNVAMGAQVLVQVPPERVLVYPQEAGNA